MKTHESVLSGPVSPRTLWRTMRNGVILHVHLKICSIIDALDRELDSRTCRVNVFSRRRV